MLLYEKDIFILEISLARQPLETHGNDRRMTHQVNRYAVNCLSSVFFFFFFFFFVVVVFLFFKPADSELILCV